MYRYIYQRNNIVPISQKGTFVGYKRWTLFELNNMFNLWHKYQRGILIKQ